MNPLVSIIIPVYGVEKYIRQCLLSVVEQTYKNLEILIIDDESPDKSGKIADEFAETDSRIKVFHISNRGAAGARNVGLSHCSGDYIMFVDSDDWLEPDAVETMMQKVISSDCEMVQCQFYNEYLNQSIPDDFIKDERVISDAEYAQIMMVTWEYMLLWNKIMKRTLLKGLFMEEGHCIDDEFFTYKIIINSSKVLLIKDCLYHYRMRKTSATGNMGKRQQILNDQIDYAMYRTDELIIHYPELKSLFLEDKTKILLHTIQNGAVYPDVFIRAKKVLRKCSWQVLSDNKVDKNIKKSLIMYMIRSRRYFEERFSSGTLDYENYYC